MILEILTDNVAGKNPPRVRFFLLASRVFIPRIPIFYVVGGEKMRAEKAKIRFSKT